jgi:MinD superfamily P-loop ATPase
MACLQWCPVEAIQYGKKTIGRKRYHHPSIAVADMFKK